jgi:hypothetical protein
LQSAHADALPVGLPIVEPADLTNLVELLARPALGNQLDRLREPARPDLDTPPPLRRMRCECRRCGAHTITNVGYVVAGNCSNCHSYQLVPIEPA